MPKAQAALTLRANAHTSGFQPAANGRPLSGETTISATMLVNSAPSMMAAGQYPNGWRGDRQQPSEHNAPHPAPERRRDDHRHAERGHCRHVPGRARRLAGRAIECPHALMEDENRDEPGSECDNSCTKRHGFTARRRLRRTEYYPVTPLCTRSRSTCSFNGQHQTPFPSRVPKSDPTRRVDPVSLRGQPQKILACAHRHSRTVAE